MTLFFTIFGAVIAASTVIGAFIAAQRSGNLSLFFQITAAVLVFCGAIWLMVELELAKRHHQEFMDAYHSAMEQSTNVLEAATNNAAP